MAKNLISVPILARLTQICPPPRFLVGFAFVTLLEAISVYNFKKNDWNKLEQI